MSITPIFLFRIGLLSSLIEIPPPLLYPVRICDTVIQFNLHPKELQLLHTTEDTDRIHQLLYYIILVPPYYMLYIP